jgi:hypothetical protein
VRQALGGRLLNVGFVPALPSTDPLEPVTARARVPHVWEMTVNTTTVPVRDVNPWRPEYVALDEVADTTAGLTRPGLVRLALPREQVIHAPANDVRSDPEAGVGDRPPRLDDEALATRLVAWIRLRPAPPDSAPAPETQFSTGQGAPSLQTSAGAVPRPREVERLRVLWSGVNAIEIGSWSFEPDHGSSGAADQEFQPSVEPETSARSRERPLGSVEPSRRIQRSTPAPIRESTSTPHAMRARFSSMRSPGRCSSATASAAGFRLRDIASGHGSFAPEEASPETFPRGRSRPSPPRR